MAKKTQYQIRQEKELLAKTKDLISAALGLDSSKDATNEELVAAIKDIKDTAVMKVMEEEVRKDVPMPPDSHKAFGVRLDEDSMTYYLTTIEYADGYAKVLSEEPMTKSLPEVQYKLGKLIINTLLKKIEEMNHRKKGTV